VSRYVYVCMHITHDRMCIYIICSDSRYSDLQNEGRETAFNGLKYQITTRNPLKTLNRLSIITQVRVFNC
jgi:hypothetical protein